jgi:hypothetical protein
MNQPPQMRVNLAEHGKSIRCEKCNNDTFEEVVYLFKISKIITGAPQDTIVPMPSFKCSACSHVNVEFTPEHNKPKEEDKLKLDI